MERCGKRNALNSDAERGTGIGVVAGFLASAGMVGWPLVKRAKLVS
jgi:hypothetical protein